MRNIYTVNVNGKPSGLYMDDNKITYSTKPIELICGLPAGVVNKTVEAVLDGEPTTLYYLAKEWI